MKKFLTTLFILLLVVSCGSKGNKEKHGSGVAVPWCSEGYTDIRNELVEDLNFKVRMWDLRASYGSTIDRAEIEEMLARSSKFLSSHENTVCRGNVVNACGLGDLNCPFSMNEEVIDNKSIVNLRDKLILILAGE